MVDPVKRMFGMERLPWKSFGGVRFHEVEGCLASSVSVLVQKTI